MRKPLRDILAITPRRSEADESLVGFGEPPSAVAPAVETIHASVMYKSTGLGGEYEGVEASKRAIHATIRGEHRTLLRESEKVSFDGEDFEVVSVNRRDQHGIYYEVIARDVD